MNVIRNADKVAHLEDAWLSYPSPEGEVDVLRGLDLDINPGEIVALTGPSGSGKSSLIALLSGLEKPTRGRVEVLDVDFKEASEAKRTLMRRCDIGVVFQSFHLVGAMTALQNASLPLMLSGKTDIEKAARELLERVGLGHRMSHLPSALSGGEQQRVAIARAFAARPRLILADEPTGNLDQATGRAVIDVMFDLVRDTQASMVMVTHDEKLAQKCDRTISLDNGQVVS